MSLHHFDDFVRNLATGESRRSLFRKIGAAVVSAPLVGSVRYQNASAKPIEEKTKTLLCEWDSTAFSFDPKWVSDPAVEAHLAHGHLLPIENSDILCDGPCCPQCLLCPQLPSAYCTLCMGGECSGPPWSILALSYQGGEGATIPLLGTKYQIFDYDTNVPVSPVLEVANPGTGIVEFPGLTDDGSF